ncbi:MAG: hypothetical protein ACN4G0_02215 [Polyangiales bacterium]
MSRNRKHQHWKWLPLAAALALFSAGCGASDDAGSAGLAGSGGAAGSAGSGGSGGDAGEAGAGGATLDNGPSGVIDNPVDQLFADPERNAGDALGLNTDSESAQAYADAARACYADAASCSESQCQAFASCCANTGACCELIVDDPPLPPVLDFQSCAGDTAPGCAEAASSDAVAFNQLEPFISPRGLVPGGNASAEGGVIIGEPVNIASQRIRLEVQFSLPIGCDASCLETAGVAFTSSAPGAFVEAEVGLLLSGSREVVNLMIGNQVADSFYAAPGTTRWSLVLSPAGVVDLFRDDEPRGRYPFDAAALDEAQLVAYGRNLSAPAESAAIASIRTELAYCDNPSAWVDRVPSVVTNQGAPSPFHTAGRQPSIVSHQGNTLVAFELDRQIFLAFRDAPEVLNLPDPAPVLAPSEPYEAMGVGDPELVSAGDFLVLFYTARGESGAGSIGAAVAVQDELVFANGDGPILAPSGEVVSFDAPSVVFRDGLWLMVVRASLASGATELQAYYTADPEGPWERVVNGGLEGLTRIEDPTGELTDPSLIVHNSAYQLYYGRRSGTRWAVEVAYSDELLLWRALGESLGGTNQGFDSMGARSPDAISRGDRIDIVYSGQDGVTFRLGSASRTAPSSSAPSIF